MKKENILRAVRIIVLVIFCLFAAKVFIGKNGSGSNDSNLTAATKKNKVSEKNSAGTNSGNSSKNTSKKKKEKEKTEVSEEKSANTGNRKYKIDYDHIIDVRIVKKIGAPSKNGVYKASVEIRKPDGTWQKKTSNGGVNTMFPESWDEARIIDEINSAWENRKDLKGRDNNMWQGISKSGVVMRGYKSPRITAYPVFEGDR